jgi:hypothetical protein
LLRHHGTSLYIAGLAAAAALAIYVASDKAYVKPMAVFLFDIVTPALLAIPLFFVAMLQLGAGRRWRSLGRTERLSNRAAGAVVNQP